jgi:Carboxypeptidase regulatory-like domain
MGIKGILVLAFGCIIWGLTATAVNAQLNRGVIEGIVTDPQGASIAGADVIVTSVDTNVASATKTNNTGYYRAVDLVPASKLKEVYSSDTLTRGLLIRNYPFFNDLFT